MSVELKKATLELTALQTKARFLEEKLRLPSAEPEIAGLMSAHGISPSKLCEILSIFPFVHSRPRVLP